MEVDVNLGARVKGNEKWEKEKLKKMKKKILPDKPLDQIKIGLKSLSRIIRFRITSSLVAL